MAGGSNKGIGPEVRFVTWNERTAVPYIQAAAQELVEGGIRPIPPSIDIGSEE